MAEKDYRCGPNFLPKWVFNEPLFEGCCADHDRAYDAKSGKLKADVAIMLCMWKQSDKEQDTFWKLRAKAQAVLCTLLIVLLPYSYIIYWFKGRFN